VATRDASAFETAGLAVIDPREGRAVTGGLTYITWEQIPRKGSG